jgi:hypothetical protein
MQAIELREVPVQLWNVVVPKAEQFMDEVY